ncbi:MAG: P-loop NTPase [Chloroflexota bacterium]
MNEEKLKTKLESIVDPDLGKTLGQLGAIKSVEKSGGRFAVRLELVPPVEFAEKRILQSIREALGSKADSVDVETTALELPPQKRKTLGKARNIIAVASGKGGVGKSSIAANLATALAQTGARVGIIDGDVYGPSQPLMFGLPSVNMPAARAEDGTVIASPHESHGVKVASMGFILNRDEAAIVRGPLLAGYFSLLFEKVDWGELDYLVFDLPPGTGDIQLTLVQKIPLDGAVIVTTPQEIALSDVRRSISMFRRVNVDILGVVENMSWFAPPEAPDKKYYIFGQGGGKKISEEMGVKLLAEVPLSIEMRDSTDSGMPQVLKKDSPQSAPLMELAEKVASALRVKNSKRQPAMEISL